MGLGGGEGRATADGEGRPSRRSNLVTAADGSEGGVARLTRKTNCSRKEKTQPYLLIHTPPIPSLSPSRNLPRAGAPNRHIPCAAASSPRRLPIRSSPIAPAFLCAPLLWVAATAFHHQQQHDGRAGPLPFPPWPTLSSPHLLPPAPTANLQRRPGRLAPIVLPLPTPRRRIWATTPACPSTSFPGATPPRAGLARPCYCIGVASSVHGLAGSHDWGAGDMLSCSSPSVLVSTRPAPQLPATAPPFPPGEKPSGEATATARHSSNRTTVPPRDAGLHGPGLALPRVRPQPLPGDAPPKSGKIDAMPSHHHPSAPPTVVPMSPPLLQQTFSGGSCRVCKLPQILGCL
ncbi:vegetative cell wall protein gp1 [Triticum aestivum]|uniref:vegetative cell wall protein gp1 n=1 Tax=Triticum aestivum TaxID=4565 RepID=UPI001D01EA41|nr:vegetative cell wall protein gp1-like [Triticum aestivum]